MKTINNFPALEAVNFDAFTESEWMLRLGKIQCNGSDVTFMNLENTSRDQIIRLQSALAQLFEKAPEQSVLFLNNATNSYYDQQLSDHWKRLLQLFENRIKKFAIYGASSFSKIAISSYSRAREELFGDKRPYQELFFDSRKEALEWLVSHGAQKNSNAKDKIGHHSTII